MTKDKIIIAIYVDNKFGVLSRVTAMFTRRGFNIDSLTVGETESPEYSRITITLSAAKTDKDQVVSQLRKLYNGKKVVVGDGRHLPCEDHRPGRGSDQYRSYRRFAEDRRLHTECQGLRDHRDVPYGHRCPGQGQRQHLVKSRRLIRLS